MNFRGRYRVSPYGPRTLISETRLDPSPRSPSTQGMSRPSTSATSVVDVSSVFGPRDGPLWSFRGAPNRRDTTRHVFPLSTEGPPVVLYQEPSPLSGSLPDYPGVGSRDSSRREILSPTSIVEVVLGPFVFIQRQTRRRPLKVPLSP